MESDFLFAMRRFRLIFALIAVLAAVPARMRRIELCRCCASACAARLPGQQPLYPAGKIPRAFISSSSRAGMCTGRTRAIPASRRIFNGRCPRASVPLRCSFLRPKRLPLGPLMDFGYENEVLFPFTLDVARTAKPGRLAACQGRLAGLPRGLHSRQGGAGESVHADLRSHRRRRATSADSAVVRPPVASSSHSRCPAPTPPSSSPRPPVSASPSQPASAKRKRNSSLKTRTSSTILRRKPSRPRPTA